MLKYDYILLVRGLWHGQTDFLFGVYLQTVSFLTYLLKSCAEYIRPHEESICKSIVNLLVTCSDSASIRKVETLFFFFLTSLHFLYNHHQWISVKFYFIFVT